MKYVADILGVSQQTITNYERGAKVPPEVDKLAALLEFPLTFFYGDDVEIIDHSAISFRARKSLTARVRDRARARGTLAWCFVSPGFRNMFEFPLPDVPELPGESPDTAASLVRNHWGLGNSPIGNMVHLLEAKGIEVYWLDDISPCVDALSFRRGLQPFVILNTTKTAGERARFDAAHELGHLVLHANGHEDLSTQERETQANQFASAFLLPIERLRSQSSKIPTLDSLRPIKRHWGASMQAIIMRLHHDNFLPKWYVEKAFKEMSRRNWRIEEPDQIPRERSYVHEVIYSRLAAKSYSPDAFAQSIGISPQELYELTPTAVEYRGPSRGHLRLVSN